MRRVESNTVQIQAFELKTYWNCSQMFKLLHLLITSSQHDVHGVGSEKGGGAGLHLPQGEKKLLLLFTECLYWPENLGTVQHQACNEWLIWFDRGSLLPQVWSVLHSSTPQKPAKPLPHHDLKWTWPLLPLQMESVGFHAHIYW